MTVYTIFSVKIILCLFSLLGYIHLSLLQWTKHDIFRLKKKESVEKYKSDRIKHETTEIFLFTLTP